jgi:hypothetical protein
MGKFGVGNSMFHIGQTMNMMKLYGNFGILFLDDLIFMIQFVKI